MPDGAAAFPTPTETIHVDTRTVACDGGDGALGHPRVFLHIEREPVMLPYVCPEPRSRPRTLSSHYRRHPRSIWC